MPVPVTNFNAFGARVFVKRKFHTYKAFAEAAGLSQNTVLKVCRGISYPSAQTVKNMAFALEISYDDLILIPIAERAESLDDFVNVAVNGVKNYSFKAQIEYYVNQSTPKAILDFITYGIDHFGLMPKEFKITERECDE